MKAVVDLASLSENQRCKVIAESAITGKKVAFIVNNDEKVIARYIRKIKEQAPNVIVERIGLFTKDSFALKAFLNQNN